MAKDTEPDWAKFAQRSPEERERLDKANARARAGRATRISTVAKRGFARVTDDMFPLMIGLSGPATVLLLVCIMYSGRRRTLRAEGWMKLSGVAWQQIGLGDRAVRSRAAGRLVSRGLLETRQPGPGMTLEYRLTLPVPLSTATH